MERIASESGCVPTREGKSAFPNCLVTGVHALLENDGYEKLGLRILFALTELKNSQAQYLLGHLYANGTQLEEDQNQAIHHLTMAAEQRDKDAALKLYFVLKAYPDRLVENEIASTYWLKKAVIFGNFQAVKLLSKIYIEAGEFESAKEFFLKESLLQPENKSLNSAELNKINKGLVWYNDIL